MDWHTLKDKPYILWELNLFLENIILQYQFPSLHHVLLDVLLDIKLYIENIDNIYNVFEIRRVI
jgi:hypothetical protein